MNQVIAFLLFFGLSVFWDNRWAIGSTSNQNFSNKPLQFNPPNNGAPGGNRSASSADTGSRDSCPTVEKAITALVPKSNAGNTLSQHPTLWFYIPYQQGLFTLILKDEATAAIVARLDFPVNKGGGIMGFPIGETVSPLEIDSAYRWQVYFSCNPDIEPQFTKVQGVVQRVAKTETLGKSLDSAKTTQEKINLYAKQGLWYETIGEIIKVRNENSENQELEELWLNLLSNHHVNLENFGSEPLVQCCDSIVQ